MYGLQDLTHDYMELQQLSTNRCLVFWRYLQKYKYCFEYKGHFSHQCMASKLEDVQACKWESTVDTKMFSSPLILLTFILICCTQRQDNI